MQCAPRVHVPMPRCSLACFHKGWCVQRCSLLCNTALTKPCHAHVPAQVYYDTGAQYILGLTFETGDVELAREPNEQGQAHAACGINCFL